jgi:SNF2 family DNA or RNA helicase
MNIFDKDNLKYDDLDFYYIILQNYLQNKNYVEYDGELLLLDEKNLIEDIDSKTILKAFSYGIDKNIELFIEKLLHLKNNINKEKIINKLESVKFKAKLKDYQEDGVLWLYNLYKNKIDGGLLADEMGLGKTIQVIAFLLLSNKKKVLIISPASLTHNWKNEISKFTNIDENGINLSIDESFITILSYETARSKIEQLKEINYDILIMDESQKIKNHKTQIFNAVSQIKRNFTIIMTGTPIENSLNDLWNMLFTINPALHKLYSKKIEPLLTDIENYEKATTLTVKMLYPIMLQRRKEDVLDLPPRDTKTLFLEFSKEEKKRYINLTNTFISAIKSGLSGRVQSIALEGLLRLRQFCSIHSIVPETLIDTNSLIDTKVEKSIELVDKALSQNEKIIIFSQFTSSLDKLEIMLNKKNFNYLRLDGSTTKANRNKIVNKFQEKDNKYSIFLISLKAGGVGLNLTSATNAILFEPWWNPAVEEQAFARIDRIGQDKKTKIYRLIYKDSIEEKINKLIEQKQNIFSNMTNLLVNRKSLEMEVARDIFRIS